jgi:hypothetical protein
LYKFGEAAKVTPVTNYAFAWPQEVLLGFPLPEAYFSPPLSPFFSAASINLSCQKIKFLDP